MSTCMDRIAGMVSLAKSKKVTDYKKAIKFMLEFWDDNSEIALEQITEYSKDPDPKYNAYSWNDIFIVVHDLFIIEIDRISKLSGSSGKLDKERIIKLVYSTTEKANYYLKPKSVVVATLQVLQTNFVNIYAEFYEMYLGILKKYVLQNRSQRISLTPNHWQELLTICASILKNVIPHVNYAKILETVELIVQYGCSLSTLLFEAKKLLPIIGNILDDYGSYNIKSTDNLFKLTFTVCQQIATDSRLILCKFAESIPLSLIDIKGPEEKYKLYLLLTQVHHPNGAILGDNISYAYDDGKWKAIINLLYKMILNDIRPTKLSKNFTALACEVFRQIILTKMPSSLQSNNFHDSLYIQPRKKRRVSGDEQKIIDLVNDRDPQRAWPMIQIATALYKKYPDCLNSEEYVEFLNLVIKLMNQACKNVSIMESLCELTLVFVDNEKRYENSDVRTYWDKVWDAVLRYLSMSHNETVHEGCLLAQRLICYGKISNPNSLLKLYLTKSVKCSNSSIETLKIFCENVILPNEIKECDLNSTLLTNDSLKIQLLQWTLSTLNRRLTTPFPIQDLSLLLIGLTLKTWFKSQKSASESNSYKECNINLEQSLHDEMESVSIEDIERCYLSLKLKTGLPFNEQEKQAVQIVSQKNIDNPHVAEDLDFLINSLLQIIQVNDADKDLSSIIIKTALTAKVISELKAMRMIQCSFDDFCLVSELKNSLTKIFEHIMKINWSKNIRYTLEISKALILLYQTKYDVLINEIILNSTNFNNLKKIYDITKIESDEFESDMKTCQCRLNAIIVLALYSCMSTGSEISDAQIKIASTLLKLKKYNLSNKTDVICVITILKIFVNISNNAITEEYMELLTDFVMKLFEEWHKDEKVTGCMLQLLPQIIEKNLHIEDKNNIHNILLICKLYHDQFVSGYFGQLSHLSLVQCLNKIVKSNVFYNTEVVVLNHDVFITFVNSPYYLVRLESLRYVYSIFSMKEIDYSWKINYFDKLSDAVYNIFLLQRELSSEEIQEERLLRSVSAVQTLATVICSKSIFQSSALFTLLRILVDKDIDANIVHKILRVIHKNDFFSNNIIEENLNYLLTSWLHINTLDTFPHYLLKCLSEADFHDRYSHVIFPVLIREKRIEDAHSFCQKLSIPFEQVFTKCCSSIIPWTLTDEFGDILKQLQDNQGYFESIGSYSTLIKENLQEVVLKLVQRLHDINHFYNTFDTTINLPASDPPHYKHDVVDLCFDRLLKIINSDSRLTVFYFMITRKPSTIQRILLQLTQNVYAHRISEYKAKAFHQYVYFCSKIVDDLASNHCDLLATYFVKDIGCTLLNLVKDEDSFIGKLASTYLHSFLQRILPNRSAQVGNILGLCVKTLTPLIRGPNDTSKVDDILVFLLKEQKQCLANAIENLGSLPNIVRLKDDTIVESQLLRENLEHFLNASDDKSCSVDSLLNLKRQLATKKSQLEELYEELGSNQGFAEHCASSTLHRLIYRLIRLTECTDKQIALEAAKCLGVLGPADLTTLILHPQETQTRESADKAEMLTYKICQMLADFVVTDDIELRRVSNEVLYVVLESYWGTRIDNINGDECRENSEFLREFLHPFKSTKKFSKNNLQIDAEEFERVFDQENLLWSVESNSPYNAWICKITSDVASCLNGFYSKSLLPVLKLNVQFCEITLPRIIGLIVDTYSTLTQKLCLCINRFFEYHFCDNSVENPTLSTEPQQKQRITSHDAIRCMLNVINHLRIQTREEIQLDFDYLPIAMAAQLCSAYFSAVLYTELWCRSILTATRDLDKIPIIDQVYEQDSRQGKIAQDILKEAYMKIGDLDSIHGCGSSHLQNRRSRIPYYTNFQKLDKVILSHDVELSVGNTSARGMIHALKESSLHYLAKKLLSSTSSMQVDPMDDLCYDSLWRLSDWSQITSLRTSNSSKRNNEFQTYHYESLKCFHENDNTSLEIYLEQAYFCIIKDLCNISLESCKAVYPKLSQLQMLREIEELRSTNSDDYGSLLENWDKQKYIFNNNFQYTEPILSQRTVMFEIRDPIKSNPIIKNALINVQLETARLAQQQGHFNVAARVLETLAKQTDLDEEAENRLLYHEAQLAWMRKDEDMARFNLRSLIKKDSIKPNLLARALRVYGNWIAETKSENPQAIIKRYYNRAIGTYTSKHDLDSDDLRDSCRARAALAQFAHEQYLVITDYMKSPQFESLKECIDYSRNIVPNNAAKQDRDVQRAVVISTKQSSNDCIELENIQRDRIMYLSIAIKNYLLTLQDSDDHDFLIFRLISLWLDNMQYDEGVNKILEKQLPRIPSYKFIPLVPQLAPHMSNVDDVFTRKIDQILERCAKDHPHHTLPILLALKNLYNDSKYCGKAVSKQEPRVLGAQYLIQQLLSTNIRPIIQEMDRLSDALVMLAYYDLDKKKAAVSKNTLPRNVAINDIQNFQHSIVPTLAIDIRKNGNYTSIISVSKYESSYNNVGGINAPKKIMCIGTDGIARPQLVKGKDDLRQDAVMQQVFTVMNSLLKSNKDAKQRKLHVRTYKVVPLTQRSGVLQWCENTLPLSCILTGDGSSRQPGLHRKYYPNDYAPNDCRRKLQAAKGAQQKYNIFLDCCKNMRPAFHHFFTESYLSPETWFERRLAYTRSIATSSIIGYILGLGDRHVSNILVDKSTAEVIHIDFGIAFEQGKVLPTPETIPFRLTRDIEVAMGVSGVEGTMRRCCEETMTVLREQREIIVTLLRVLLYDPLYSWAITPAKAATYQSEHSARSSDSRESNSPVGVIETNKLAERALLRVQQKLQGIEEGVASSIAGQVERLIQQARDPSNLSRLFEGWQAYL